MGKIGARLQAVSTFFADVMAEMRKSVWPERQELIESTVVVIVSVVALSLFVGIGDKVIILLLRLITQ